MTIRRTLGITALITLALAAPVSAAWWKTKTVFRCVEMNDIVVSSPNVPGSGAFYLTACTRSINDQLTDVTASILVALGRDGNYQEPKSYVLSLTTKDLIINSTMTQATLHLPDGSIITWRTSGNGDESLNDAATHVDGRTYRHIAQEIAHWAVATGTFNGVAFDAQNATGSPRETTIFKITYLDE